MSEGLTWDAIAKKGRVALGELLVSIACGVPGPGNAGNLGDAAAAQLVQHERSVIVLLRLLIVGLDAAHKVQLCPAIAWRLSNHEAIHHQSHRQKHCKSGSAAWWHIKACPS